MHVSNPEPGAPQSTNERHKLVITKHNISEKRLLRHYDVDPKLAGRPAREFVSFALYGGAGFSAPFFAFKMTPPRRPLFAPGIRARASGNFA